MPVMTPAELHKFLEEHFPQAAHLDLKLRSTSHTRVGPETVQSRPTSTSISCASRSRRTSWERAG